MGHEVFIQGSLAVKDRVPVQLPDAMRQIDKSKLSKYNPDKPSRGEATDEEQPRRGLLASAADSQFPPQDFQLEQSHFIAQDHVKTFEEFTASRNEHSLDRGYIRDVCPEASSCHQCQGAIAKGSVVVVAPKCGETVYFHPGALSAALATNCSANWCTASRRRRRTRTAPPPPPPVDQNFFCERHFAEQVKPRCGACDEMILAGEYTRAMNRDWHASHFCCSHCVQPLTGKRYVLREGNPVCLKCYEEHFANPCTDCQRPIGIEAAIWPTRKSTGMRQACFLCSLCKQSLVDRPFGTKEEKIYCGNCYDTSFGQKCDGCSEIFRAGTKKLEYKGRQWHEQCFVCISCKHAIGTGSFVPKDNEIYCGRCYEEKFALRCTKCADVITTNGITYKSQTFHKECFLCTNCSTQLAGQKFTVKEDKPYCATCYAQLFAKRCTACQQPIVGQSGGALNSSLLRTVTGIMSKLDNDATVEVGQPCICLRGQVPGYSRTVEKGLRQLNARELP
ncbi:Four and a half LIM domains protein 2 [Hypsibius exemplaris]|uniref:Four and a half LIM domains protein 2 n=1 Tax=Hypsibius exemplaris TaxID=2072580 RepID=A0A1W0WRK9_HYPEX|nr:Four and a half LIM domains protein 2 [Hypsibius exemplaris]